MGAGKAPTTPRGRDKGKADKRREKKTYYAKLKKDEDDKLAELAEKVIASSHHLDSLNGLTKLPTDQ